MKLEHSIVVVVVYRGCAAQVHVCRSEEGAKAWIQEYAEKEGKSVEDMQEHDYDFSIWVSRCDDEGMAWEVVK